MSVGVRRRRADTALGLLGGGRERRRTPHSTDDRHCRRTHHTRACALPFSAGRSPARPRVEPQLLHVCRGGPCSPRRAAVSDLSRGLYPGRDPGAGSSPIPRTRNHPPDQARDGLRLGQAPGRTAAARIPVVALLRPDTCQTLRGVMCTSHRTSHTEPGRKHGPELAVPAAALQVMKPAAVCFCPPIGRAGRMCARATAGCDARARGDEEVGGGERVRLERWRSSGFGSCSRPSGRG